MGIFQQIAAVWQKIGLMQRAMLAALTLACVLTAGLLVHWASRPQMQLLFGNLDVDQCAQIADKIAEKNVPYEVRNGGRSIFVPADQVYTLRAALARDGLLPKSSEPGYEIFDTEKIGVSPLVQKMNYNRALQGELAKTIQVFEGVEFARVHLVRPEQTMFTTAGEKASASVMVKLKPGYKLTPATVQAICNLVAHAVEGLTPDKVTIADSNGTILTKPATADPLAESAASYKDYKTAVENDMANRLTRALEAVLGAGKATVLVQAVVDMTQETIVSTNYEKGIPVEEMIDESSAVQQPSPASADANQTATVASTEKSGKTTSKYMLPETRTTRTTMPGKIIGWSVSVIADLSKPPAPAVNNPAGENNPQNPPQTPTGELLMTEQDVRQIIKAAVGPDLIKDEHLTVKHVPFSQTPLWQQPASASLGYETFEKAIEIIRQSSVAIMSICALLALKIITRASRKLSEQTAAAAGTPNLLAGGLGMLPAGSPEETIAIIRQQIAAQLRENPERVRQVFNAWLAEDR